MAEPITTSATAMAASWGLVASTLIGFITSVDYSIVFGAFAGSMCFVVTARELSRWQTLGYFVFGYVASLLCHSCVVTRPEWVHLKHKLEAVFLKSW
ncbi:putative holin [Erwinia phyllosphaerae]|uniref:putative holin n=1 Tax=Erwinia phyllosphaerae TaxID=2853256 RepID=UPI001FEF10CE|nr:putative holin [Erwinia phyllosphaerae]MBV4366267.1 phage holin family protein [Erwinia phyllosphaerae]